MRDVENQLSFFSSWPGWKQKPLHRVLCLTGSARTPLVSSEALEARQTCCAMERVSLTASGCWQWWGRALLGGALAGVGQHIPEEQVNPCAASPAEPSPWCLSQESVHGVPGGDGRGLRLRAAGAGAAARPGPARQRRGAGIPPVHPL